MTTSTKPSDKLARKGNARRSSRSDRIERTFGIIGSADAGQRMAVAFTIVESPDGMQHGLGLPSWGPLRSQRSGACYLDPMPAHSTALEEELAQLSPEQRAWVEADLALRERARELAARLALDEGDTYHQLKQLMRSPSERLRLGLAHGRLRRRITE